MINEVGTQGEIQRRGASVARDFFRLEDISQEDKLIRAPLIAKRPGSVIKFAAILKDKALKGKNFGSGKKIIIPDIEHKGDRYVSDRGDCDVLADVQLDGAAFKSTI